MKLILTKGIDIVSASEQVIADIAPYISHFEQNQIIIVPDRYSLIAEKLVFEKLNISSTLNIKVMGINRFGSLVLQEQNLLPKSISTNKQLISLGKAVFEQMPNFTFFPKTAIGVSFLQQIKNTISQLKTSSITPDDLEGLAERDKKFHDIYLIYKNYEEKQKDGVDLADFLDVFIEHTQSSLISGSRIYFAFFDSMTSQGLRLVKALTQKAESVEVAISCPEPGQKNKFLYDIELYKNLIALAKEIDVEVEEKTAQSANYLSRLIMQNIYQNSPLKANIEGAVEFWECMSAESQFEAVAKEIKSHVVEGGRFLDVVVATSDLQSQYKTIKRIFQKYEIPCFFDVDRTISQTKLIEFLNLVFQFQQGFDLTILGNIFSNIYINVEPLMRSDLCEFLNRYSLIDQELKLNKFQCEKDGQIYEKINELLKVLTPLNLDENSMIFGRDFVLFVRQIFDYFCVRETTQKIYEYYVEKQDLESTNIYRKLYEKVEEILNNFEEETCEEKLRFDEFVVLLNNVFESTKLGIVPLGVDEVFVGDAAKSFFESGKIFFLCDANQDKIPDIQKDIGLLSDKDIKRSSSYVKINPTIRVINQRKRMKLCSLLAIPKQKLYVSWLSISEDGKKLTESSFILGLQKMFGGNVQKIGFASREDMDFAKEVSCQENAKEMIINYLQMPKFMDEIFYNSLFCVLKKNCPNIEKTLSQINHQNVVENLEDNSLFFPEDKFSVSAIETYAKCPFMFFVKYGLNLDENQPLDLDESKLGNIIHLTLEKYFSQKNYCDIGKFVDSLFSKLEEDEKYSVFFAHKKYRLILSSIKKECKKAIADILEEQKISKFKIDNVERWIGGETIQFDFGGRKITFGGIVDRIDRFGNKIVVVDYKTGKVEHSVEDVIFGNKIQIFIYADALQEIEGTEAVGALYYPISAKRKKSNSNSKMFKGFLVDDSIEDFDTEFNELGKSKILGVKQNKDGSICQNNKTIVTQNDFNQLMLIAKQSMEQNLKNISYGFISPTPLKTDRLVCSYCKFLGICKHDQTNSNKYRTMRKQ